MILSKYDIEQMTDGQREIFFAGVKFAEARIVDVLKAKADQAMRAGQGKPVPERMEFLAVEISLLQVASDLQNGIVNGEK